MKIAVRYQSRNGNTRAAAEIVGKSAGAEVLPVSEPLSGYTDILFVGGGVYMSDIDKELAEFLKTLDKGIIGQIAAFSTTGTMDTAIRKIRNYASKAGIVTLIFKGPMNIKNETLEGVPKHNFLQDLSCVLKNR